MSDDHDHIKTRQDCYLHILQFGILRIREDARAGRSDLCAAEAIHLHNIPSLVFEENEHRHAYYFEAEKEAYLEQIGALVSTEYGDFALRRYREAWRQLDELLDRTKLK